MTKKKKYTDWVKEELVKHVEVFEKRKKSGLVLGSALENFDHFVCAEEVAPYGNKQNISPFFYDPQKKVKLYNGDALSLLKKIPDNCIDLIFADPPYFGNQSGLIIKRNDGHAETFDTQKAKWAYSKSLSYQFEFHYTWLKEAQRILKDGSTIWITGTYHSIGVVNVVLQDLGFKILNDVILHKRNAPPNFRGSCFRAVTETMLWAKKNNKGKTKFNYRQMKELNGNIQMKNLWEYWAENGTFMQGLKAFFVLSQTVREPRNDMTGNHYKNKYYFYN